MDYLQEAKGAIVESEGDLNWEGVCALAMRANAYAAIAQAEQQKRIADALERWVGPAVEVDPELADYHRNAIPGESIDESY